MKNIKIHFPNIIRLVNIIAFLVPVSLSFGQDITTYPAGVTNKPNQFFVENGGMVSIQFLMDPSAEGAWEILPDGSAHPNNLPIGYSISPSTGSFSCQLPYEINPITLQYNFTVRFNFNDGTPSNSESFSFKVKRPGAHVMLVLDKSGSMYQKVTNSSTDTKWDVLKWSVINFLEAYRKWEEVSIDNPITGGLSLIKDKIGVTYYSHQRSDYTPAGLNLFNPPPLNPADDPKTRIIAQIPSLPGGATCLGGGVIAAYQSFAWSETQLKHIIVFSDGLQNINPKFNKTDTECKIYKFGPEPNGFLEDQVLDFNDQNLPKFKIHTICIGDNVNNTLMEELSKAHPEFEGKFIGITSPESFYFDLNDGLLQIFEEMLANFSPQKVYLEKGKLINGQASSSFDINQSADRIFIQTVGSPQDIREMLMTVSKGNISFPARYYSRTNSAMNFYIHKNSLDSLNTEPGGKWKVNISGKEGSKYSITCIVNDEYIDYNCSVNKIKFIPGEPITCNLKVWADDKPVQNLDNAMVYLYKPSEDVNDLFSNTSIPDNIPKDWPSELGNFAGQDKFEKLITLDTAFVNRLKLIEIPQPLINIGNGNFSTVFTGTKESGVYKFIFRFSGHDNETGTFERYFVLNKVLDFGFADISKTEYRIKWSLFKSRFEIKPINQFGHLFGPNRLSDISISLNEEKLQMFDNLNGVYTVKIPNLLFLKKRKQIMVEVKNNLLFNKTINEIPKKWKPFNWLKKY